MKKLKLNLQQFEGAEVLTRSQLKRVLGGGGGDGTGSGNGGCCAHTEGWTDSQCGYSSQAEAEAAADKYAEDNHVRTFYCCQCPAH